MWCDLPIGWRVGKTPSILRVRDNGITASSRALVLLRHGIVVEKLCAIRNSHPISDLPEAEEHVPHRGGPRRGLDHPDGVAHRQRARQGLRLQQRPRGRRVLQQGVRARRQEPLLSEQVSLHVSKKRREW